jgi:hypothetical protein
MNERRISVKKQKCVCGNSSLREFVKMNTSQKHVSVTIDGKVAYDAADTVEAVDGTEDWVTRELECETCGKIFRLVNGVLLTTKKLVIKVNTLGDYEGNTADYSVVELDVAAIDRIRKLSQKVRDLKAYCISEFNNECKFFVELWDADPDSGLVAMDKFEGRMDCILINVTDNDFYWSGNYNNTHFLWETSSVPLMALDEPGDLDERCKYPVLQEVAI